MGMSVLERTREIGVLRALGRRKRRALAVVLGAVGGPLPGLAGDADVAGGSVAV